MEKIIKTTSIGICIFAILAFFAFGIPILLNFLLPIDTGLNIIGGNDSSHVWLVFWGAYLSALGSFVIAVASLYINRQAIKQNEKLQAHQTWNEMAMRYNHLEKFIVFEEKQYSEGFLYDILYSLQQHTNNLDSQKYIAKKSIAFSVAVLQINRFLEEEKAFYEMNTETRKALFEYGMTLQKFNVEYGSLIKVKTFKEKGRKKFLDELSSLIQQQDCLYNELQHKGQNVLIAEKKRLLNYAKQHDIEAYL